MNIIDKLQFLIFIIIIITIFVIHRDHMHTGGKIIILILITIIIILHSVIFSFLGN